MQSDTGHSTDRGKRGHHAPWLPSKCTAFARSKELHTDFIPLLEHTPSVVEQRSSLGLCNLLNDRQMLKVFLKAHNQVLYEDKTHTHTHNWMSTLLSMTSLLTSWADDDYLRTPLPLLRRIWALYLAAPPSLGKTNLPVSLPPEEHDSPSLPQRLFNAPAAVSG